MGALSGRTALVTGGAKSIGKAFARALAAEGANVAIADIADGGETARAIAADYGVVAESFIADVSREDAVAALVAAVLARFSGIDILVNNAAFFAEMPLMPYHEIPVEMWDKVMAVNVRGAFLMCKHTAPHMVRAGRGKIINIGSGTAHKGMPDMLAYVTSKAAILGLTRSLSRELGRHGVTVNTLSPGLTESESLRRNPHHLDVTGRTVGSRAIPRNAVEQDLTGALVFLASPASDFITGQTIAVDGGSINT